MDGFYQIGPFSFQLTLPEGFQTPLNLARFAALPGAADYHYTLEYASALALPRGQLLARQPDLLVLGLPEGEGRLLGVKGGGSPYGFYQETGPRSAHVSLSPAWSDFMTVDTVFTSLLALERRMIGLRQLILHCAYIRYQGEAILFSAPSETGKSTQAGLWEQYRGAVTVNGDRALLGQVNGRWTAQGWPVCGSSEICHNEALPIRAIVMLSQAPENTVRPLGPAEAMRLLFSQVTVNRWNPEFTGAATDLVLALAQEVPMWHLGCTISQEAVEVLGEVI